MVRDTGRSVAYSGGLVLDVGGFARLVCPFRRLSSRPRDLFITAASLPAMNTLVDRHTSRPPMKGAASMNLAQDAGWSDAWLHASRHAMPQLRHPSMHHARFPDCGGVRHRLRRTRPTVPRVRVPAPSFACDWHRATSLTEARAARRRAHGNGRKHVPLVRMMYEIGEGNGRRAHGRVSRRRFRRA